MSAGPGQSALLLNLRSAVNLRDAVEHRRNSRRVGKANARQGDAQVFKKYSQMKLQLKREALEKINRQANEMPAQGTPGLRIVMLQ